MTWRSVLGIPESEKSFYWQLPRIVEKIMSRMLWLERHNMTDTQQYELLEDAFDKLCNQI